MAIHLSADTARLLDCQHGVIARWQAPAAGLGPAVIDNQIRYGRWQPLYRGVYATFTGTPPREAVLWAGLLRAGPGAVLSHHTAAELDGLTDRHATATHVTVALDRHVRLSGTERHGPAPRILVHRVARIDDVRHPARTPPRTRIEETILDLTQASTSFDDAFSWLCRGCGRQLATPERIAAAARSRPRIRWRDELLGALCLIADGVHSLLEFRYVHDVERGHGLPTAKRQARMLRDSQLPSSRYLDNLYRLFGVVVELDGRAYHPAEDRWQDIRRDNASVRMGIVTLRFGWADVTSRPCEVAATVSDALRRGGWTGTPQPCGPACTARTASEWAIFRP